MQKENIEKEEAKKKSRNLSTLQFYEMLQLEYIVADLRSKIYPKINDKEYWKRVKNGKKETIEKIAERNKLPSIFNDSDLRTELESRVYRLESYPVFIYRDQEHRNQQEYYDLLYYYNKGADVRFEYYGEIKVGTIVDYKPFFNTIKIHSIEFSKEFDFPISKVTRIL